MIIVQDSNSAVLVQLVQTRVAFFFFFFKFRDIQISCNRVSFLHVRDSRKEESLEKKVGQT